MEGFAGFKSATTEELPDAVTVMDPFHVVRLTDNALDRCRRRVQHDLHGHRRRTGDHVDVDVEVTWSVYQRMIAAYRDPDRTNARVEPTQIINSLRTAVPISLTELRTLGQTLNRRAKDVLAYFDRPRTSNEPTEAFNGRLEHLRGIALGFRNLTNYIARSLLESGGFKSLLHPDLR